MHTRKPLRRRPETIYQARVGARVPIFARMVRGEALPRRRGEDLAAADVVGGADDAFLLHALDDARDVAVAAPPNAS